jgi:hypothetical protein
MIAVAVTLLSASGLFAEIKTDYDRSVNFSQCKTCSWLNVSTRNPLMVHRIKTAVNAALSSKGWMEVPSGGDAAIVAMETTHNQQTLNTFYDGYGGGWRWRGFGGFGEATTTVENYRVGSLVFDIFDARTEKLIWRGSDSDMLSNNSDKNIKELDKHVKQLFDRFPPHPKE